MYGRNACPRQILTAQTAITFSLLALSAAASVPSAQAQNLYWDANGDTTTSTGGTGTWDTTSLLWRNGSATAKPLQTYGPNADPSTVSAQFAGSVGTVTIASGTTISANNVTFTTNAGATSGYTLASADSTAILNLSGSSPSITGIPSTNSGFTEIAAKITGASGFTLTGINNVFAGDLSGLTGMINVNSRATLQGYAYSQTGVGAYVLSGSQNQTWSVASGAIISSNNHGSGATIPLGALTGAGTVRGGNDNSGNVTPGGDDVFQVGALNSSTTFTGTIIDQSASVYITGLTKVGTGTLTLSSTGNSYTGGTVVSGGVLALTGSLTGGVSTAVTPTNGTGIATSSTGVFMESNTGIISGNKPFTQGSSGTSTLGGTNTYNGATIINAGVLAVTGSTAAGSNVTINGGTLTGTGTVYGNVEITAAGKINPGGVGTVGTLTTAAETFDSGSTLTFDYASNAVDSLVCSSGVSDLSVVNFIFSGSDTLTSASYTLITAPMASSFATTALPKNVSNMPSGYNLQFNGNALQLVRSNADAMPEPSAWCLAGLGLLGIGAQKRRARRTRS